MSTLPTLSQAMILNRRLGVNYLTRATGPTLTESQILIDSLNFSTWLSIPTWLYGVTSWAMPRLRVYLLAVPASILFLALINALRR